MEDRKEKENERIRKEVEKRLPEWYLELKKLIKKKTEKLPRQ